MKLYYRLVRAIERQIEQLTRDIQEAREKSVNQSVITALREVGKLSLWVIRCGGQHAVGRLASLQLLAIIAWSAFRVMAFPVLLVGLSKPMLRLPDGLYVAVMLPYGATIYYLVSHVLIPLAFNKAETAVRFAIGIAGA